MEVMTDKLDGEHELLLSAYEQNGTLTLHPERKKLSTACNECKRRKRKCASGPPPCPPCRIAGTACVFEADQDKRKRGSIRQVLSQLESHRGLLFNVLGLLRYGQDYQVQQLLQLIRGDVPLPQLAHTLQSRLDQVLGPSSTFFSQEPVSPILRDSPEDLSKNKDVVIDGVSAPYQMSAYPWTSVTSDNHFASELLSLYLTWQHPCFHLFQVGSFLEALSANDPRSPFCSPLLVNSMFAIACFWSDRPEACAILDDRFTVGAHFYEEAQRLWNDQLGEATLPNVQALMILSHYATYRGFDKLGLIYAGQSAVLYRELNLHQEMSVIVPESKILSPKLQDARRMTAWSVAFANSWLQVAVQRPTEIAIPEVMKPNTTDGSDGDWWHPYPIGSGSLPAYEQNHFNLRCDLTQISISMQNMLFRTEHRLYSREVQMSAQMFAKKFTHWHERMTNLISDTDSPPTHSITLRLQYNFLRIALFGYVQNYPTPSPIELPADSLQQNSIDPNYVRHAQRLCINAANDIAFLVDVHSKLYDSYMPTIICLGSMIAAFTLLEDLSTQKSRSNFIEMVKTLYKCTNVFPVAKGMLRMVAPTAAELQIELPQEVKAMIRDFEKYTWRKGDEDLVKSVMPNFALKRAQGSQDRCMSELLDKWGDFRLGA